jgi:hypothetical protein
VSGVAIADPSIEGAIRAKAQQIVNEVTHATAHPAFWLRHTQAIDAKTGETFDFDFKDGWEWQAEELSSYLREKISLRLKARQLGGPGWDRLLRLEVPDLLRARGRSGLHERDRGREAHQPRLGSVGELARSTFASDGGPRRPRAGPPPDPVAARGRQDLLAARHDLGPRAGHGETAGVVFLDEFGRHPYAAESWKAFIPVVADGGQLIIVSTANGFGNEFLRPVDERCRSQRVRAVPRS